MLKKITGWIVEIKKSYVYFTFKFDTAEGAADFYEMIREAYVDTRKDNDNISVSIYAENEEEDDK